MNKEEITKWVNNRKKITTKYPKPCHKLNFCPYGQLVEIYPLHEKAKKYAKKNNLYCKLTGAGWIPCSKNDPMAKPDTERALKEIKEPHSCKTFGHDCPVYYLAENYTG